jgi:hypothetical protein
VYTKVSEFIGWGSSPGATNLASAKTVVHRGYRRFIYPINPVTGRLHTWSFLEKQAILNTESGKWIYNLPIDFQRLTIPFRHEIDSGFPRMVNRPLEVLWQMRAGVESTSYPHFFAIKTGRYVKEIGTTYEVVFFETPNANYFLNYSYIFRPQQLSATTDVFVGGDFASEAILEHCLAVAEQEYDDTIGVHTQLADKLTNQLIQSDVVVKADSVGKNIDTGVRYIEFTRPLPLTTNDSIYS